MPLPFPGRDPFTESQKWRGFHTCFITAIRRRTGGSGPDSGPVVLERDPAVRFQALIVGSVTTTKERQVSN